MRKTWRKIASLLLSLLICLSTTYSPVLAAEDKAAPTAVTECSVTGFMTEILTLGFEDTDWMNAINNVIVNDTTYTKGTINSWGSNGNLWEVGSVTGAYGSYTALKIVNPSTYPASIKISANGYQDLNLQVTKNTSSYPYVYTATVVAPAEKTYSATAAETENGSVQLSATKEIKKGTTVTVTPAPAENYELDTIKVTGVTTGTEVALQNTDGIYTFVMPEEDVTVSASFKKTKPAEPVKIELDQLSIATDFFGTNWNLSFKNADNYAASVTDVKVNGESWENSSFKPSAGGKYYKDADNNLLVFSAKDFSANPEIPVLRSGDVITITADGYQELTFKFVIDTNGNASLTTDDGQGDPYELHVKLEGSFESAIIGQQNYDSVSSASVGGATSSKNSSAKVYGAITAKGTEPTDADWEELDHSSKINLNGSKCSVSIVPDTEKGTPADSDSGMSGVYMTISSDLTLNGTPKDAGAYLISVSITDTQGRTAVSNALPFNVYTGEETLADRLTTDNLKQYGNGLYAWDIMEPWAIKNFGSNVEGEENSVRVPKDLEAWFGSHQSGTYGYLGYDLPWKQVQAGNIPQTLYIPAGCNLTMTNMEILSSVHIVVESGGKLTLSDSVVQGIIDVENGGTFSMNYDSYNQEFTTGASLCGQLRLQDGAILENASIYSHINYLANGDLTDRSSSDAVVVANGNVTVKGQVFIAGDEAGSDLGQTALLVKDGTVNLEDNAVLVTYGGGGNVLLYAEGGSAIELDNGNITGNGKVVAIGGDVLWGNGGNAVIGNGMIATSEAFLQGATSRTSKNATPGNAISGNVKVTSANRHIENGTQIGNDVNNDPLEELYWTTGVELTPPLDKFVTNAVTNTFTVADIENHTYTGEELTPAVTVQDGETVLTEGTDYFITYKNEDGTESDGKFTNAGTYTVVVTGIGNYYGTIEKTFTIAPKELTFDVALDSDSVAYDGTAKTPALTVKDVETVLTEGVDYTVSCLYGDDSEAKDFADTEFINAGSYKLIVTGIGNYIGSSAEIVFTITDKKNDDNKNDSDDDNKNDNINNGDNDNKNDNINNGDNTNKNDNTNNGSDTKNNSNNTNNSTTDKTNGTTKTTGSTTNTSTNGKATDATGKTSTTGTSTSATTSPKTGDDTNVMIWIALLAVSCTTLTGAKLLKKKSK